MVDSVVIHPVGVVRDLDVLLDSELTMKSHINKLVITFFFAIWRLRQLKRHVNRDVMKQLVSALILSRLEKIIIFQPANVDSTNFTIFMGFNSNNPLFYGPASKSRNLRYQIFLRETILRTRNSKQISRKNEYHDYYYSQENTKYFGNGCSSSVFCMYV